MVEGGGWHLLKEIFMMGRIRVLVNSQLRYHFCVRARHKGFHPLLVWVNEERFLSWFRWVVPVLFDHELGKFHLLNLTSSEEGKKIERKEGRGG